MQLHLLFLILFTAITGTFAFPAPGADDLENRATLNTYQETMIRHHNVHRANHSARDLAYGPNLQKYARELADYCTWGHNTNIGGGGYGQVRDVVSRQRTSLTSTESRSWI